MEFVTSARRLYLSRPQGISDKLILYLQAKLTPDHINLTSFSKMKVSLAVQVLSKTVALGLRRHYSDGQADETAKFCEMVNR